LFACPHWHHAYGREVEDNPADEREVEDNPDVWVPHVSGTRERKARGSLVHTKIQSLQHACKWGRCAVSRT
jgi:hypothetical protein